MIYSILTYLVVHNHLDDIQIMKECPLKSLKFTPIIIIMERTKSVAGLDNQAIKRYVVVSTWKTRAGMRDLLYSSACPKRSFWSLTSCVLEKWLILY